MDIATIYGNLPTLETERLRLRKITEADAKDMFAYGSNEEVAKYVTWYKHESLEDTKAFIAFILKNYELERLAPWGIEHKESGKLIGTIDFVVWQTNHQSAEIAYVLHQDYWGQGLATEAVKAVIAFGFEHMELVRIQARCLLDNTGSYRVMEKAGMCYEGTLRKCMKIKGVHEDLKVYAIVKQ